MPEMLINFKWVVDDAGYEYVPDGGEVWDAHGHGQIVRRGGKLRLLDPIGLNKSLFMEFANLEETPEACINFANRFGQLDNPDYHSIGDPTLVAEDRAKTREDFGFWLTSIWHLRRLVEDREKGFPHGAVLDNFSEITSVYINLVRDPHDGLIKLNLIPTALEAALILQFYQAATSGRNHIQCASPRCGKWFEVGPGGKRRGAKTCSDKCRFDLSNIKRAEKKI